MEAEGPLGNELEPVDILAFVVVVGMICAGPQVSKQISLILASTLISVLCDLQYTLTEVKLAARSEYSEYIERDAAPVGDCPMAAE